VVCRYAARLSRFYFLDQKEHQDTSCDDKVVGNHKHQRKKPYEFQYKKIGVHQEGLDFVFLLEPNVYLLWPPLGLQAAHGQHLPG
jgi:hypothetical protein